MYGEEHWNEVHNLGSSQAMGDDGSVPLISFGIVADVQYADKDNGNFEGLVQWYREAPEKLSEAIADFNDPGRNVSFVLTLGDIIDGNVTPEKTEEDFDVVLKELIKLQVPAVHVIGNHCLSLPRETLMKSMGIPARYFQKDLGHNWSLVVLDSMDMSVKWPVGFPNHKEAMDYLESHPLGEQHPQMSLWNGGIGQEQKQWLQGVLSEAENNGVKLIIAQHHPLVAASAAATHVLWNHEEVLSLLLESPAVALFLCGHYHPGGYACVNGKHFVTVEAILQAPTGSPAHGVVTLYQDKIHIQGTGTVTSRELQI